MKRVYRYLLYALLLLVIPGGCSYFYLYKGHVPVPAQSNFGVDLEEVRALAGPGVATAIRSIKVGDGAFPDWVAIAGGQEGADEFPADWRAFQVVYPDRTVLIDPVHNRDLHESFPLAREYDDAAFALMQEWVGAADLILATHGHWDHVGGVAASPHIAELASRVRFTREQLDGGWLEDANFPEGFLASLAPLEYERLHRIAPGMVLIKAPGHTPGSQLIYLRLRSGREILFVGDVVWNLANLRELRGHGRFVGLTGQEDLEAKAHQIRWLHDLWQAGAVELVIAHDRTLHEEQQRAGLFEDVRPGR